MTVNSNKVIQKLQSIISDLILQIAILQAEIEELNQKIMSMEGNKIET